MNIMVVDNDPGALGLLTKNIRAVAPLAAVYAFAQPSEALEWAGRNPCDAAFLAVELSGGGGLALGKRLQEHNLRVNLIFVAQRTDCAAAAYALHASGYLCEPVLPEAIRAELENLRYPVPPRSGGERLVVHCFGNFEVFYRGKPLAFKRSKSKELFAFLVDRNGAQVTPGEICARLWEDETRDRQQKDYLRHLVMDLSHTLGSVGQSDVFVRTRSGYRINPSLLDCDYYDYLRNVPYAVRACQGEYMQQYSWAEERIGSFRRL